MHSELLEPRQVEPAWETPIARQIARRSFMNAITSHGNISSVMLVRMNCRCFAKLCRLLAYEGGLRSSWNIEIDEMVAIFLYTIAHNEKNLVLQVVFRRSGETISRVIHLVLIAVLKLHTILYRKPKPIAEDSTDPRWKYFKNCVGALDGTHITLRVPKESQQRYRTRKGTLAMNVLGVCNPDMEFIYTLAGWEGSAQDGRVLRDALIRPNGLKVSKGLSFDLIHVSCVLIDKSNSCKQYWCTIFFTSVDNHFLSNRALLLSRCRL
ncbi:hypothetical protein LINPERPRIM_LOCUS3872 [Linum perenne]